MSIKGNSKSYIEILLSIPFSFLSMFWSRCSKIIGENLFGEICTLLPTFVQQYKSTDDFFLVFFNSTPLIIIGTETFEKMIEYGLSGFHCTNVYE